MSKIRLLNVRENSKLDESYRKRLPLIPGFVVVVYWIWRWSRGHLYWRPGPFSSFFWQIILFRLEDPVHTSNLYENDHNLRLKSNKKSFHSDVLVACVYGIYKNLTKNKVNFKVNFRGMRFF